MPECSYRASTHLDSRLKQTLFGNPMLSYYVHLERPNVISNGAKRNEKSSRTLAKPRSCPNNPSELPIYWLVIPLTGLIEDFSLHSK